MTTATSIAAMQDMQLRHTRSTVGQFLSETRTLNLERDLTYFLLEIFERHQEEVKELKQIIQNITYEKEVFPITGQVFDKYR